MNTEITETESEIIEATPPCTTAETANKSQDDGALNADAVIEAEFKKLVQAELTSRTIDSLIYGSVRCEFFTDPKTGLLIPKPLTIEEIVERDRLRVVDALGLKIDPYFSTRQFDRQMSISKKKYVLIDLSGTLHIEDEPTNRAVISLRKLRAAGFKLLFVTNTTKESKSKIHDRLMRMGFDISIDEVFTSLDATRAYVEEQELRPMFLVAEEAMEDFAGISTEDPNAVVVGLSSKDFCHERLSAALRLIKDKNAEIVAVHKGHSYKTSKGTSLGPGPFIVALEFSSQKKAVALGKPEAAFFAAALKYVGCDDPQEAIMIGDDIRDDVYGSQRAGITGALVKTGKFTEFDFAKIEPHQPDFVFTDFCNAVEMIVSANNGVYAGCVTPPSKPTASTELPSDSMPPTKRQRSCDDVVTDLGDTDGDECGQ